MGGALSQRYLGRNRPEPPEMPPQRPPQRGLGALAVALCVVLLLVLAWGLLPSPRWGSPEVGSPPSPAVYERGGTGPSLTALGPAGDWKAPEQVSQATATVPVGQWTNLTGSAGTAPLPRYAYSMAYDPQLGGIVLFGGRNTNAQPMGDTWEFARGGWTNITASLSVAPAPRAGAQLVYDPGLNALILFGGHYGTGAAVYNDTWEFDAGGWVELHPVVSPPVRTSVAMVYDSTDGYILLWGLNVSSGPQSYWKFQGDIWTNITSTVTGSLPSLALYGADDPAAGAVLFYGGFSQCGGGLGLTYTYSAGVFRNLTASQGSAPAAVAGSGAMAYVPTSEGVVLFSGYSATCELTDETWLFHGGSWVDLTSAVGAAPPGRWGAGLVYDPTLAGAVTFSGNENLFGGTNLLGQDTWAYEMPLKVNATATPRAGLAPLAARFAAGPSGGVPPYRLNWSFDDGSANSTTANVTHTFNTAGNYSVNLTVVDAAGHSAAAHFVIYVLAAPTGLSVGSGPFLPWFALGAAVGAVVAAAVVMVALRRNPGPPPAGAFVSHAPPPPPPMG